MLQRTLGLSSSPPTTTLLPLQNHQCPFSPQNLTRNSPHHLRFRPPRCHKMFVPGFGEASPEAKAATNLHHFFTFLAVKIVLAQLEGYNPEAYKDLMEFTSRNSLSDGDEFCAKLMRESPGLQTLALRILEMADESNTRLMRDYVLESSLENE